MRGIRSYGSENILSQLSPKELNFCKDVATDILRSTDNFSWIQEGKYYLNCWKYQLERSWYCSCVLFGLGGRSAELFHYR